MTEKEIFGAASVVLGIGCCLIYMWQVYRRQVRPHLFSWLIWAVLSSIGFAVALAEKAGAGAWTFGTGAVMLLIIAIMSYFYGEKRITKSDWTALIVALAAIPVWLMTDNPLWAVVIISGINLVACYPTFRKSWARPGEESALTFFIGALQFLFSILAQDNMTFTTLIYPGTILTQNILVVAMLLARRAVLAGARDK